LRRVAAGVEAAALTGSEAVGADDPQVGVGVVGAAALGCIEAGTERVLAGYTRRVSVHKAGAEGAVGDAATEARALGAATLGDGVAAAVAVTAAAGSVGAALVPTVIVNRGHGNTGGRAGRAAGSGAGAGAGSRAGRLLGEYAVGAAVFVGGVASTSASVQASAAVSLLGLIIAGGGGGGGSG